MDRPHRASDIPRPNTPDDTVLGGGSPLAAVSSGELVFGPATSSISGELSILQVIVRGPSDRLGLPHESPPGRTSAEHESLERHWWWHSTSPCPNPVDSRYGAQGDGSWMQAPAGAGGASSDVMALDSFICPFYLTARPMQASPMTRSSPYELSQVTVYVTAPSQPSGVCSTTTVTSLSGPRVTSYWSHPLQHQCCAPSLHRPHWEMGTILDTTHQRPRQHGTPPEVSDLEGLSELQPDGSTNGGASRITSPRLALCPSPYLPSPSHHHFTSTSHPMPMIHAPWSLDAPRAAIASFPPHPLLTLGSLLHECLVPSDSDVVAAYPPDIPELDWSDDDEDIIDFIDHIPDGMPQDEIENLLSYYFNPEVDGSDDMSCVICMSRYEAEERVRVLPCGHEFHACCINKWLVETRTCPVCRRIA